MRVEENVSHSATPIPVRVMATGIIIIVGYLKNLEPIFWRAMFLGENLLPLLTLAIGGAMAVGTIGAFAKPRTQREGELERPPVGRSIVQIGIGLLASAWAIATLLS